MRSAPVSASWCWSTHPLARLHPDPAEVRPLLAEAGIELDPEPATGNAQAVRDETAAVTDLDLLARVDPSAADRHRDTARAVPRRRSAARRPTVWNPRRRTLRVRQRPGRRAGRPADGQASADELIFNAITYAAGHLRHRRAPIRSTTTSDPAWQRLKSAVIELQALQITDGSVPETGTDRTAASVWSRRSSTSITEIVAALPARRRLPRRPGQGLHPLERGRFRCPRLPGFAERVPPGAEPGRRSRAPGGLPDVHPERQPRPSRRSRSGPGHLAGVRRRSGGRRLLEQAVRADPVPRLHPRLRHQLRRAVPGNRCHARGSEVHLGRDLRRPGGRPLPHASSPRPPRPPSWRCRRTPPGCWRTSS